MHLYKYREFSLTHIQAVTNNELWFSVGSTFNDPFDSQPPMVLYSPDSLFDSMRRNSKFDTCSDMVIRAWADTFFSSSKMFETNAWDVIEKAIVGWSTASFIHCLSRTNRSILMWSHYANFHKGFCVRYKLDKLIPDLDLLTHGPVQCDDESKDVLKMLKLETFKNLDTVYHQKVKEIVISILMQKAKDWEYEKEYRLILSELSASANELSKCIVHSADAIDGIFFGVNSTEKDRAFLKGALSGRDIEFQVMKKHELDFKLVPHPYIEQSE